MDLQNTLIALGYLSEECHTGEYDRDSRDAVAAFQKDNGLEETGVLDQMTRIMLLD